MISPSYAIKFAINDAQETVCSGGTRNIGFYLSGDTLNRSVFGTFIPAVDRYISYGNTETRLWRSDDDLVTGCDVPNTWIRLSRVAPADIEVMSAGAPCLFHKTSDINNRTVQFTFNVNSAQITENGSSPEDRGYATWLQPNPQAEGLRQNHTKTYNNYQVDATDYGFTVGIQCLNIELNYCGDGEITHGENCDPEIPNSNPNCNPVTCIAPPIFSAIMSLSFTDANPADLDTIQGDDSQTVEIGSGAIFNVSVVNIGADDLENIVFSGSSVPACEGTAILSGTTFTGPATWTNLSSTGVVNGTLLPAGSGSLSYECNLGNIVANTTIDLDVTGVGVQDGGIAMNSNSTQIIAGGIVPPKLCGNGIINIGEVCDPNDPSVNPIGWGTIGCSQTCLADFGGCEPNGVLDEGETCDPLDISIPPVGWGVSGCSLTCEPIGPTGGGPVPQCRTIDPGTFDKLTNIRTGIVCTGNSEVVSIKLECGNEDIQYGTGSTATFTCDYSGSTNPGAEKPICFTSGTPLVTNPFFSGWDTRLACTPGTPITTTGGGSGGFSKVCGDGVVQRPNDSGVYEQCDGNGDINKGYCSSTCKLNGSLPEDRMLEMFPPNDYVIIGGGMNPYAAHSLDTPYIKNISTDKNADIAYDEICVYRKSGESLAGVETQCEPIGIIYPQETVFFGRTPSYSGFTTNLLTDTGENVLIHTVRNQGVLVLDPYFGTKLQVRVAKPTIVTTGGGTSFVKSPIVKLTDIAEDDYKSSNKNFVGAGVGADGLSYTKDVTDTDSVNEVKSEGGVYNTTLNDSISDAGSNLGSSTELNDFENYNGIENVYILKNYNFEINSSNSSMLSEKNGSKTYIIENGDLIISANIDYDDNIAFVVKGGNIRIEPSVNKIDGVYITIPKSGVGGEFTGGSETDTILKVNGSLYGKIDHLVSTRTYVKNTGSKISVGTIVSFGSSIFRKPAPLTGQFIGEYLESEKMAR